MFLLFSLPLCDFLLIWQWKWRLPGLLTSCGSSSDGRLLVCAVDPQNGFSICEAASGRTLHHVSGTTARMPSGQR